MIEGSTGSSLSPKQTAQYNKVQKEFQLQEQIWNGELVDKPKGKKTLHKDLDFKISSNGKDIKAAIRFNQTFDIIYNSQQPLTPGLKAINLKFNGLCEIICNKVLLDDLLGVGEVGGSFLKDQIKVPDLDLDSIKKSHLLNVYSVFRRMLAFLFKIYPENIFTNKEQKILVRKTKKGRRVNKKLFRNKLSTIENGTVLKLSVFKKTVTKFSGHSLLIKKIDKDEYIFFDPNKGEYRNLSTNDLIEKVNEQIVVNKGTDIFLMRGSDYIKKLQKKKIVNVAKSKLDSSQSSQ